MSKDKKVTGWQAEDAKRLKGLFDEKAEGKSQEQFGAEHGIGTQGMVWQYLNAHRPLNIKAAIKFSKGLRCKIRDFSPTIASMIDEPAKGFSLEVQQPLSLYSVSPDIQSKLLNLFDKLTPPQQNQFVDELQAAVDANVAVVKHLGSRMRVLSSEKAAKHLPPASRHAHKVDSKK